MRIISRVFALLLIPFASWAQTAAIPPLTAQLPAVVYPAGRTASGTVQGKTCTVNLPSITLQPANTLITTQPAKAPVSLSGAVLNISFTGTINCTNGIVTVNPDGTQSITGLNCTVAQVVTK